MSAPSDRLANPLGRPGHWAIPEGVLYESYVDHIARKDFENESEFFPVPYLGAFLPRSRTYAYAQFPTRSDIYGRFQDRLDGRLFLPVETTWEKEALIGRELAEVGCSAIRRLTLRFTCCYAL